MLRLGFDERWVKLIMLYVTSVEYRITQNDEAIGLISPQKGLRQRDPLSPYLFILRAEGLSILLSNYEARGLIHGCNIA